MDGHEQSSQPHISENISRLLIDELEPGNYSLKEGDVDVTIQITNIPDSGQHIVVRTVSNSEKETMDIKVKSGGKNKLPEISAVSRRAREDSDTLTTYWHTYMPEASWDGRFRSRDTMNDSELTRFIRYVLSPNKQLILEDR